MMDREYKQWGRGWKWANDLASKMGRVASAPVNLEPTFIWYWKLEQFDNEFDKDLFILGYRDYHRLNKFKG